MPSLGWAAPQTLSQNKPFQGLVVTNHLPNAQEALGSKGSEVQVPPQLHRKFKDSLGSLHETLLQSKTFTILNNFLTSTYLVTARSKVKAPITDAEYMYLLYISIAVKDSI